MYPRTFTLYVSSREILIILEVSNQMGNDFIFNYSGITITNLLDDICWSVLLLFKTANLSSK